jgi:hypothetical protein
MFRSLGPFKLVILLLTLFSGASALAQSARIVGQVTDKQGASVPDATVQVVSQDSTINRQTKTDGTGYYSVLYLPPGDYQVLIQATGFGSVSSKTITLAVNREFVFSAQLSVAAVSTEVTVNENIANTAIELSSANISTTLSEKEVTGYGLNGRNFTQLMALAPGVSNQTGQDEAKVGVVGSAKFSVNGGRVEYNTFEVDGSDVLNTSINASRGQGEPLMVYPSIDAIEEMKVLTADYSAQYGKSASGSVIVTTKSGTPDFHGNVYEFLRNEMFNARNYFDPPGRTPLYRRQDFGATLGGPIYIPNHYNQNKTKSFFFFSEEMRLEKTPVEYNQAVPTMAERGLGTSSGNLGVNGLHGTGDFSDVCPAVTPSSPTYYLTTTFVNQYPDCPYLPEPDDSAHVYAARAVEINPISQAILNTGLIPAPTSNFGCNTTNTNPNGACYVATVSPPTYWREELFRVDHALSSNEHLSFRYIHDAWNTVTLTPQWGIVRNSFPTVENKLTGPGLDMVLALAQILPHQFVNRIAFAYSVEHITLTPQLGPGLTSMQRPTMLDDPGAVPGGGPVAGEPLCQTAYGPPSPYGGYQQSLVECPMGHIFDNGFNGNKMPGLSFQGTNGAYGGHGFAVDTGFAPWNQANPTYDLRDDASRTFGKHALQFGGEVTIVQQNELSAVSGANSGDMQGLMTFSNQGSINTSGNAFVDFLAGPGLTPLLNGSPLTGYTGGNIKSYTQDSGQRKYYNRYQIAEAYLQDDWKITPRLTINVGLRASFFGAWHNPKGTAWNWLPSAYNTSLGESIYVSPQFTDLIRAEPGSGGAAGSPVPLNLSKLDPTITNGLVQCGGNSNQPSSCMTNKLFHPSPRVGFSWDATGDGKTAVRAGYGLFWEHGTGYEANTGSLIGSAPLILSETQSNITGAYPNVSDYNRIGLSCQAGSAQCGSNFAIPSGGATFPVNVTSIPTKAVYSYTQQWSFSVQRELKKNLVAQVAYVGTKGTHLTAVQDLNQLPPLAPGLNPFLPGQPITSSVCSSGSTGTFYTAGSNTVGAAPVNSTSGIGNSTPGFNNMLVACTGNPGFPYGLSADALRQYRGFSNIIGVSNIANSIYHGFQGSLRETTGPLTIGIAYTFSHSIDDSSDRSSANFANSMDLRSNRASSDFDQRQLLNISYIYDLPFLRLLHGYAYLVGNGFDTEAKIRDSFNRVVRTILGNWQVSGITTYQSGTPFSIVNEGGANGTAPADNAGVADGLGIGSYLDKVPGVSPKGIKPYVAVSALSAYSTGPLLLNPAAYQAPQGLTFGNSGRNSVNNPSRINYNVSLLKTFHPTERSEIEFRAEAYNVFNHTQFRIYDPAHPGNTGNNVAYCYGPLSSGYSAAFAGDTNNTSCLTGNSFLHPVDAHDPRIMQFGLKLSY